MKKLYITPLSRAVFMDTDGTSMQATSLRGTSGALGGVDNEGTGASGIDWGNVKEEKENDIDWEKAWKHIVK